MTLLPNWFKVYGGKMGRYHLFLGVPGVVGRYTSLCGELAVTGSETKTPGAWTCERCERKAMDLLVEAVDLLNRCAEYGDGEVDEWFRQVRP